MDRHTLNTSRTMTALAPSPPFFRGKISGSVVITTFKSDHEQRCTVIGSKVPMIIQIAGSVFVPVSTERSLFNRLDRGDTSHHWEGIDSMLLMEVETNRLEMLYKQ
jgi:hypothetical protein